MSKVVKAIGLTAALIGASFIPGLNVAVAGFLFNAGLSVGLSVLAQALTPKPGGGARVMPVGTVQDAATTGENASAGIMVGRWATRGHMTYTGSFDTPDGAPVEWFTRVVELSDITGVSLRRVAVGGEWLTLQDVGDEFGMRATNDRFVKDGAPYLFIRFYNGTQTQADPYLVNRYGAAANPYTTDMVGTGIAYAIVTYRFDPGMWQGNINPLFELNGAPMYDPRLDSTVGGSGAHRWGNPSTYQSTENPIVIAYNVARGIVLPGGQTFGGNLGADSLPVANWSAAMNVCDVVINPLFRPARNQYTFGTEILVADMEPADVIEACLAACQGQISEMGGVFRVQVGAPAVASYAITDGDLSADDPASFAPIKGLASRYNGIVSAYTDPAKFWEPAATSTLLNAAWEAEDGGRRLVASPDLPGVFNASQAAQLQAGLIADERRQRQHQIVLPPDALQLRPLDTLSWTSTENGYVDKLFEVVSIQQRSDSLFVPVTIRERDPADYDWSAAQDVPDLPAVLQIPPALPRTMTGWAVAGVAIPDADGVARRPAIRLSWTAAAMTDIDLMQWELRLAGGDVVASGTAPVSRGEITITAAVLPGGPYEARGRPIAVQRTAWTGWLAAVAPDAPLQLIDFDAAVQDEIDKGQQALDLAATKLDTILPGTVGVDELVVGLGRNEIANALPAITGTAGWSPFLPVNHTFSARGTNEEWSHPTEGSFVIHQTDTDAAAFSYAEWRGLTEPGGSLALGIPVTPGQWIEFSAHLSSHRCTGYVEVVFVDAAGAAVSGTLFGTEIDSVQSSSTNLRMWPKSFVVGQVPTGAVYARPRAVKAGTVAPGADSYLFFARPMFADTKEGAEITPFSAPASTYIGPQGIATNAVTAEKITAEVVRAKVASFGNLSTVGLVADNASIGDAQITTAKIGFAQVDKLRVTGSNLVEGYLRGAGQEGPYGVGLNTRDSNVMFSPVYFSPNRDTVLAVSGELYFSANFSANASNSQVLIIGLYYYANNGVWMLIDETSFPKSDFSFRLVNLSGNYYIPAARNTGYDIRVRMRTTTPFDAQVTFHGGALGFLQG